MRRVPNPRTLLSLALMAILFAFAAGPAAKSASAQSSTTHHKKKASSHHRSRREPFQKAPTNQRISEIQSALSRSGYYQGDANGKWDSNTVAALQKFQSENNLNPSGKLDATSLQKLGLGSSTAGLNPPTPPQRNTPAAGNSTTAPGKTQSTAAVNSASNSAPAQPR
jgi:peptidoglycan hydrolase-like protein with peptidoglycan-binding domain